MKSDLQTPSFTSPAPVSGSGYFSQWQSSWDQFWFASRDPIVLGVMRVFVGLIVLYTHLVWTLGLSAFLGSEAMLPEQYRYMLFGNSFAWSHLDWLGSSPIVLMSAHVVGLIVIAMFTIGFRTRWTGILTALLVISYANRGMGSLFGLDQINGFLCLYLAIGNAGSSFSWDVWRKSKNGAPNEAGQGSGSDVWTNIATRMIQIHMCVVYGFAAIGKLQGETWFTGEAIWRALASYEYQTLDMTWLAGHMPLVAVITLLALAWELCYPALIWPRLTRPLMLAIAIPIHLGIGICMGMLTFGLIMLVGNLAFVEPDFLRRLLSKKSTT